MQAVRQKVINHHSGAACAEAAAAARVAADGPRTRPPSDALSAMVAARNAQRASDRVEAALVAAKERAAVARQGVIAADREVTKLTAEAKVLTKQRGERVYRQTSRAICDVVVCDFVYIPHLLYKQIETGYTLLLYGRARDTRRNCRPLYAQYIAQRPALIHPRTLRRPAQRTPASGRAS